MLDKSESKLNAAESIIKEVEFKAEIQKDISRLSLDRGTKK